MAVRPLAPAPMTQTVSPRSETGRPSLLSAGEIASGSGRPWSVEVDTGDISFWYGRRAGRREILSTTEPDVQP